MTTRQISRYDIRAYDIILVYKMPSGKINMKHMPIDGIYEDVYNTYRKKIEETRELTPARYGADSITVTLYGKAEKKVLETTTIC